MGYSKQKKIQRGTIEFRRLRKRIAVLFVGFNLWLNFTIDKAINYSYDLLDSWGAYFGTLGYSEDAKYLLIYVMKASLFLSIIFWIEIILALRFVRADYLCVYEEAGRKQKFIWIAIVFNLFSFLFLNSIF